MKVLFSKKQALRFVPFLDWAIVLLAIVLFTMLVVPNLVNASAYFDEGYSAYLARFDALTIAGYTALDVHPPLYYVTLNIWQGIVGGGVAEMRLLSLVFAWVAIVFAFLIVRRWFGRRAALMALLLLVLSPLLIRYASSVRMYTMALAIVFASTYVLLHAVNKGGKKLWALYAVLVAVGLWTNYFTALVWMTHLIWLFHEHRNDPRMVRSWRGAYLTAFILYLPWLPMMLLRYGAIQSEGFWIKPISLDTITSTVTQAVIFRSATDTKAWLAIGVITLVVALVYSGRSAYRQLSGSQKPAFRLLMAMSSLPVIILIFASLPPLRPAFVYRYVLVSAVFAALVIAVILTFTKFKKYNLIKQSLITLLAVVLFACGASHAVQMGNRNLDTNTQNKLAQAVHYVKSTKRPATIVLRSPYDYYTARLYETAEYDVKFIYSHNLIHVGSTKPLYDQREESISNFDKIDKVWLVGQSKSAVEAPKQGKWNIKDIHYEYDDVTKKVVAVAAYYERME